MVRIHASAKWSALIQVKLVMLIFGSGMSQMGQLVREAQRLRRRSLEGHQRSLRDVAAELARLGHVNAAGPRQQEAPVAADADDRGSVESHRAAARCP